MKTRFALHAKAITYIRRYYSIYLHKYTNTTLRKCVSVYSLKSASLPKKEEEINFVRGDIFVFLLHFLLLSVPYSFSLFYVKVIKEVKVDYKEI